MARDIYIKMTVGIDREPSDRELKGVEREVKMAMSVLPSLGRVHDVAAANDLDGLEDEVADGSAD